MPTNRDPAGAKTASPPWRTAGYGPGTGASTDVDGRAFFRGVTFALLVVTPFWTLAAIVALMR